MCVQSDDPGSWAVPEGGGLYCGHLVCMPDSLPPRQAMQSATEMQTWHREGMRVMHESRGAQEGSRRELVTHPYDSTVRDVFLEGDVVLWNRGNVVVVLGHDFVG